VVDPEAEAILALDLTPAGYRVRPQGGRISSSTVAAFVLDVADLFAAVRARVALLASADPDAVPQRNPVHPRWPPVPRP